MKLLIVFGIFVVIAYASAIAAPEAVYDGPVFELNKIEGEEADDAAINSELAPVRHRRVTCDLFSWQSQWLSVNHAACAAKCIAQRRRGGTCRDGICICR